jgi:hypothetical protein
MNGQQPTLIQTSRWFHIQNLFSGLGIAIKSFFQISMNWINKSKNKNKNKTKQEKQIQITRSLTT